MALTSLTHLFANQMALQGSGHILNVASLAGWMAIPNQNVYAASKAYAVSFSQALSNEMVAAKSGVQVTALCPGYTAIVVPGLANKFTTIITRLFSKSLVTRIFGSFYRKNMD